VRFDPADILWLGPGVLLMGEGKGGADEDMMEDDERGKVDGVGERGEGGSIEEEEWSVMHKIK
jgi:hypothetical protein